MERLRCLLCDELVDIFATKETFEKHYTVINDELLEKLKELKGRKVLILD